MGVARDRNIPFLVDILGAGSVLGLDISTKSLELAQRAYGSEHVRSLKTNKYEPSGDLDLVFCNGVFHHIAPAERPASLYYIFRGLKPGGVFALWENNPWNPLMRYAMSRIAFHEDAQMLSAPSTRGLVKTAGFEILRTDFRFIFPGSCDGSES